MKPTSDTARHGRGQFIYSMLSEDHTALDGLFQELVTEARRGERSTMSAEWQGDPPRVCEIPPR